MNVLITGAASGIGNEVKNYFIKENHNVIALDIKKIEEINEYLISYDVDITNEDKLNKIKEELINRKIKFDMIINIAGIHKMASLVESDYEMMKKVIDINLCGTMLVNKVFYDLLNHSGRIVIVTSEVASFDPMPFNSLYNISKTALDCYAQGLRQELNLLNQKVITIRPGAVETALSSNSLSDTEYLANNTILYHKQANKFLNLVKKFMGKPIKAEKMAKFIYKKSIKNRPRLIYQKHRNFGLVLLNILPKRLQCFIIKSLLNSK